MTAPQPRATAPAAATLTAPSASAPSAASTEAVTERPEWPKMVHAYRRQPHLVHNPRTGLEEEKPVEVVFMGEKVLFRSNEAGHVVAEVKNPATYDRLTKEIPEAYIPYAGGENLPTAPIVNAEHRHEKKEKPEGVFVLESANAAGEPIYKVLDGMSDDELRAFGKTVGLGEEDLPDVLSGETLMRAIYNRLAGSAN